MLRIAGVSPGSIAFRQGIRSGDVLLSINGHRVRDSIDVQYLSAEERVVLDIQKADGRRQLLQIAKASDTSLGIELPPLVVRRCRNRCLFCFVDQMPAGCRKSLSVKDDDYRASFLFGNYITLGNLQETDWDRIFAQHLSPLYISVHATEPDLRHFILGNLKAPDILHSLHRLAAGGIRMHTQIVLCPGINDGRHLIRTVEDLAALAPAVQSIAAVPVGLTRYRKKLFLLREFRPKEAREVVTILHSMGTRFRRQLGTRLVYASDEFYIKARLPFPKAAFYEDFPQIENGVGMTAEFLQDAVRTRIPRHPGPVRATLITGTSFAPVLRKILKRITRISDVSIRLLTVRNEFFGSAVTVTGLLTGRDMIRAVKGKRLGDFLVIPANTLKDDGFTFLDDRTLPDLEGAAGIPVLPARSFRQIIQAIQVHREGRKI